MMFIAALVLAGVDWYAVARRHRALEMAAKPATLIAIILAAWLLRAGPHDAWQAGFFLAGLALSLAGDVALLLPGTRAFLAGLVAFLLAHLAYIAGLNPAPPPAAALVLVPVVAVVWLMLFRAIAVGLRRSGETGLLAPVAVYSVVLALMLLSAWATLFRPEWSAARRALVIAGATLFFASDTLLAWNRFVGPAAGGRLAVMVSYHLGQLALAASIAEW
jgi:uncharacterized membrane protein YhhN